MRWHDACMHAVLLLLLLLLLHDKHARSRAALPDRHAHEGGQCALLYQAESARSAASADCSMCTVACGICWTSYRARPLWHTSAMVCLRSC